MLPTSMLACDRMRPHAGRRLLSLSIFYDDSSSGDQLLVAARLALDCSRRSLLLLLGTLRYLLVAPSPASFCPPAASVFYLSLAIACQLLILAWSVRTCASSLLSQCSVRYVFWMFNRIQPYPLSFYQRSLSACICIFGQIDYSCRRIEYKTFIIFTEKLCILIRTV